ncbi:MAG TPA: F0F1 ATP synthase subunit delta [Spirochaetia bacterium]|nr:F0F1 ATP synthase subunit delta [Spirochaetia bacterium]
MADSRRAWALALLRAMPEGEARERCAAALEAGASVLGREGAGGTGARAFFLDPSLSRAEKAEALASLFPRAGAAGADPAAGAGLAAGVVTAAGAASLAGAAGGASAAVAAADATTAAGAEPDPGAAAFRRFAALLVERRRSALLPGIAAAYRALLDEEEGLVRIELVTARPLAPGAGEAIGAAFAAVLGKRRFALQASRDPAILGGFVLKAGSVRLDRSAAGRLERLRRELARPLGRGGRQGE